MILDRLLLRDFCLYRGQQVFELSPTKRRGQSAPITLFGGINGGGKTTLLDAVQLVLYGNRARCSKRADKPYEQFLRESIHHGIDPAQGASVTLSFRYAADGEEHLYKVARSWRESKGNIRERVQVTKNGQIDGWMSDNWNQLVEDLIPLGISQLCFFDAEKIRFLAEDETSTQALGDAVKSLLGLDLAERLIADAVVLEARVAKRVKNSPELEELVRLEELFRSKEAEVDQVVQELGSLENPRQAAQASLREAEETFARVGGEHWENRSAREREQIALEHTIQQAELELVALAATDLPLSLVPELLRNVAVQSGQERTANELDVVCRLLTARDKKLLAYLKRNKTPAAAIALASNFLDEDRQTRAAPAKVEQRLRLSIAAERVLEHLLGEGVAEHTAAARRLLDRIHRDSRLLEDVQRSLAATPKEDAVRGVAEALKEATAELARLDQQAKRLEKQLSTLRLEREQAQQQLQKLRRKLIDEDIRSEQDARLAALLGRTKHTMSCFLKEATARKIGRLSEYITESFRFLLRKQSLVHRVNVDAQTFAITLFDDAGRAVPKQRLSEGEKQIFAISVLWGLSRASGRPLPTIVDTPMARLDAKHRDHLVERYFPNASHQVIVLSTDTEVERRYFHQLQPFIARAYHLNYDEGQKLTAAEEGYFWEPEPAQVRERVIA